MNAIERDYSLGFEHGWNGAAELPGMSEEYRNGYRAGQMQRVRDFDEAQEVVR